MCFVSALVPPERQLLSGFPLMFLVRNPQESMRGRSSLLLQRQMQSESIHIFYFSCLSAVLLFLLNKLLLS